MAFTFHANQPSAINRLRVRRSKRTINRLRVRRPSGQDAPVLSAINFTQINLGKRIAAMTTLAQRHSKDLFVSMMQEPHTLGGRAKGKISGLDSQHCIYKTNDEECRAAIYAHKDIPIWMNHELSDKDVASCLWVTRDNSLNRVLVISCYWDRFLLSPPQKLTKAIEFAQANNFKILLGMDSNARSVLTGSTYTDSRGILLENLILKYNLDVVNKGNRDTFESHVGKSCIDVTLASPSLATSVKEWHVDTTDNHSDHHTIVFKIDATDPPMELKRDFSKLDPAVFSAKLEERMDAWI